MSMTTQTPEGFVQSLNQPEIDFVIIADRAEVVNGKLYLMGGGYDRIVIGNSMPHRFPLSFAVGVLVPWNACNIEHRLQFAIEDPEGRDLEGFGGEIGFNVGRPPGMEPGESQRVMVASPLAQVMFPAYGTYILRVTLNGTDVRKEALYLNDPKA